MHSYAALRLREQRGKFRQAKGYAFDVVLRQKAGFVASWFLGKNGPVFVGRALDDLVCKEPIQLRREPAAQEEKASSLANLLHRMRNRRLDVDLCNDFNKVGVRHKVVARRPHRTEGLVK